VTEAAGLGLAALTLARHASGATQPGPHGLLFDTGLTSFNLAPPLIIGGIGAGLFFALFWGPVLAAVDDRELGSVDGASTAWGDRGGRPRAGRRSASSTAAVSPRPSSAAEHTVTRSRRRT
jgi:hypothetical protein